MLFVSTKITKTSWWGGVPVYGRVVLPLRLIFVKSNTVPLVRRAVDKFNGCSSVPPPLSFVHPSMSAMLCPVGVLGGLPYTWGCHVPATAG